MPLKFGNRASGSASVIEMTAGSVALPTQADVEAFAATGATVIEGNLTIGDFSACDDPVTDLAPLAGLTDVRYNIVVGNSFAGEKLSGLENLRSAGGLVLGTATTPLTTAQDFDVVLPALESLGQLSVNGNTVAKLDLPNLNNAELPMNSSRPSSWSKASPHCPTRKPRPA